MHPIPVRQCSAVAQNDRPWVCRAIASPPSAHLVFLLGATLQDVHALRLGDPAAAPGRTRDQGDFATRAAQPPASQTSVAAVATLPCPPLEPRRLWRDIVPSGVYVPLAVEAHAYKDNSAITSALDAFTAPRDLLHVTGSLCSVLTATAAAPGRTRDQGDFATRAAQPPASQTSVAAVPTLPCPPLEPRRLWRDIVPSGVYVPLAVEAHTYKDNSAITSALDAFTAPRDLLHVTGSLCSVLTATGGLWFPDATLAAVCCTSVRSTALGRRSPTQSSALLPPLPMSPSCQ
ncbi:Hypothetical predicted protein [Marmota monax]|uniref:Uncharacterized protein n=1 Tax=Marmota monax TaxID=9995 RepID=A0A5E4D0C0_MARMO|nr:Hypothetical predicted protein [Marmota monax]